eukprot:GHUV01042347.1.p1 GENE.GHUV01042347.1~~GHUV01042347.1.p1  ORF type:complete len:185 (+),score=64.76 GHUV01042347.1:236-790(+)
MGPAQPPATELLPLIQPVQSSPTRTKKLHVCICAGPAPTAAVRLLQQLRLFDQVLKPPPDVQQLLGSEFGRPCVEIMAAAEAMLVQLKLELSPEDRRLLLLAALLLPLRSLSYSVKANKQQPATAYIIRESLKWRVKEVDGVALLHAQVTQLAEVKNAVKGPGMQITICGCAKHVCVSVTVAVS